MELRLEQQRCGGESQAGAGSDAYKGTLSRSADPVPQVQGAWPAAWLTGPGFQSGLSANVRRGADAETTNSRAA